MCHSTGEGRGEVGTFHRVEESYSAVHQKPLFSSFFPAQFLHGFGFCFVLFGFYLVCACACAHARVCVHVCVFCFASFVFILLFFFIFQP